MEKDLVRCKSDVLTAQGVSAFALAIGLLTSPAHAQSAPSAAAPSAEKAASAPADYGNDIVVTAQKRDQRLQDVPTSITVLTGADLEQKGMLQLADYAKEVPGMSLIGGSGPGQGQVVLRGITTGSDHTASVSLYLDDIPLTASSVFAGSQTALSAVNHSFDPDLADVERIEVLEGPQSTLYGASAEGGLIKFVTRKPNLNAIEGSARASLSQVDGGSIGYGIRGSVNLPLVEDKVAVRASAFYRRDPGFIDNVYANQRDINRASVAGGTLSLRIKLSDTLEDTLTGLIQNIDADGVNQVYLRGSDATLQPTIGRNAYSSPIAQPSKSNNKAIGNTTTLNLGFATLTNVASYARTRSSSFVDYSVLNSFTGGAPVSYEGGSRSTRYSDELRLASAPGRLEWLIGGFYTHEKDLWNVDIRGATTTGALLPTTSPFYNVYTFAVASTYEEKAVFGDLTYHLTSQLEGTVGIRYSANHQSFTETSTGLLGSGAPTGSSRDSATNYLATIGYRPVSNLTVYLRAASAYRPGGPNDLTAVQIAAGVPSSFKADRLWNYEAGVKGTLLNHLLTYSASIYHMQWTDLQITVITNNFSSIGNAGKARSDGVEASLQFEPVKDFTIGLKAAYVNAKLTVDAPTIKAHNGDPLPFSPRFTATVPVDYRFPVAAGTTASAGLTFAHRSAQHTGFSDAGSIILPAYDTLDLRAGLDWSHYSLLARIDNVTNSFGVTSAGPTRSGNGAFVGSVLRPRTYGVSLQVRF
jgi:outer membrane receptor protein involved in Fe transport